MRVSSVLDMPLIIQKGMSDEEIEELWMQHCLRARMTEEFLNRTIDAETFLDLLAEQGFNVGEVLTTAEDNLSFAASHGLILE